MADYDPFAVHEEEEEETQPPPPPPPATAPVAATTTVSGPAASSTADSEPAPQAYDPFAAVEEDADPPATTATTDMDAAPTTTADATGKMLSPFVWIRIGAIAWHDRLVAHSMDSFVLL